MRADPAPLDPPVRLLCGPGPTNVEPSVLAAMGRPMLGHLDPDLHDILLEVVAMLRQVYRAPEVQKWIGREENLRGLRVECFCSSQDF